MLIYESGDVPRIHNAAAGCAVIQRKDQVMGLFSKLFGGDKEAEKAANSLFNELFKAAEAEKAKEKENAGASAAPSAEEPQNQYASAPEEATGPSGFSWGPVMPAEENQYNFNGPYTAYFEKIFHEEFQDLTFERKDPKGQHAIIYTFFGAAGKARVIELLSSSSEAKKVRENCHREGTPYLRFYIDYEGWWNTKAYVIDRMQKALGR